MYEKHPETKYFRQDATPILAELMLIIFFSFVLQTLPMALLMRMGFQLYPLGSWGLYLLAINLAQFLVSQLRLGSASVGEGAGLSWVDHCFCASEQSSKDFLRMVSRH